MKYLIVETGKNITSVAACFTCSCLSKPGTLLRRKTWWLQGLSDPGSPGNLGKGQLSPKVLRDRKQTCCRHHLLILKHYWSNLVFHFLFCKIFLRFNRIKQVNLSWHLWLISFKYVFFLKNLLFPMQASKLFLFI